MSPDFGGNNIPPSPDGGVADDDESEVYSAPEEKSDEDTEEPRTDSASEEAPLFNVILVKDSDEEDKYSFLYTRVFCL